MPFADGLIARASARPLVRTERVRGLAFTGHVYDLQVREDETFVAEGIVVHNCRCLWLPHFKETETIVRDAKTQAAAEAAAAAGPR
jgi:hypothetical protein